MGEVVMAKITPELAANHIDNNPADIFADRKQPQDEKLF